MAPDNHIALAVNPSVASNLALALAGVIAAVASAIIAYRKLRPETTSIQITSADTLVDIAAQVTEMVRAQRDELLADREQLRSEIASMKVQLREVVRDKRALEADNKSHLLRIQHLEDEVTRLRRDGVC